MQKRRYIRGMTETYREQLKRKEAEYILETGEKMGGMIAIFARFAVRSTNWPWPARAALIACSWVYFTLDDLWYRVSR